MSCPEGFSTFCKQSVRFGVPSNGLGLLRHRNIGFPLKYTKVCCVSAPRIRS